MSSEDDMIRVILIVTIGISFYYCVGYTLHKIFSDKGF